MSQIYSKKLTTEHTEGTEMEEVSFRVFRVFRGSLILWPLDSRPNHSTTGKA
jgi:hypothetical protein